MKKQRQCKQHRHVKGYWTDDVIVEELKIIINEISHFPLQLELTKLKKYDIQNAIREHGGMNRFRKIFGQEPIIKPNGYWSKEKIVEELSKLINQFGYFPAIKKLMENNRYDLVDAMYRNGGVNKFRKLMGYEPIHKTNGYWSDNKIIDELKVIIDKMCYFPSHNELIKIKKYDLLSAISSQGGINKFRKLMGYDLLQKSKHYWSDETIIKELKIVIDKIGHFPYYDELVAIDRQDIYGAIAKNGGINKFRELLGYKPSVRPDGYWNDETIVQHLKPIEKEIGHFPTRYELTLLGRQDICGGIALNGGTNKFRVLLGYTISMHEKYISNLMSYITKRGKNSEKLVKKILMDYCKLHNLPSPSYNVRLSKGNVIEFVCNTDKRIGIDVTNNTHEKCVSKKWTKKFYHTHLDELWIVVFSDVFSQSDYHKWNQDSPDNVKVFSIYQFLEELDYSLDEYTKSKIDKYCKCTFHTKKEFKSKNAINTSYEILPSVGYNLCVI